MSEPSRKLLIVDDDEGLRKQLRWALDDLDVSQADERASAVAHVRNDTPAVVLLDLGLPPDADGPTEGLATLEDILREAPNTKVIIITGQADRDHAIAAVAKGAYDYYQKPIEIDELRLIINRALYLYDLEEENRRRSLAAPAVGIPGFHTVDPNLQQVIERVKKVANTNVSVLILGESGTGKELIANAIHALSPRKDGPFVPINCAAIPDQLLESELFGHEKGAFTGAIKTTQGRVELADGGTLFLDEIGDMPAPLQAKLLRFLEDRSLERIGGRKRITVDLRVVSATNKNLAKAIESKEFREDLYYRLSEVQIVIPPLRDRPDDIVLLAKRYAQDYAYEYKSKIAGFSGEALAAISQHTWRGNVRELQNRLRSAILTASGRQITSSDLDLPRPGEDEDQLESLKEARSRAERESVLQALAAAKGNVSEAARILKVSRPTVYDLLKTHRIEP